MRVISIRALFAFAVLISYSNAFINSERFTKFPTSHTALKNDFFLMEDHVRSALSCATKCSEKKKDCRSFAWNKQTLQCLFYSRTFENTSPSTQHDGEWEHFIIRALQSIAVSKPTEQSSMFLFYESCLAVDGNRSTDIDDESCSHTAHSDDSPWWRVDLLNVYYIVTVRMVNRGIDRYGIDVSDRLRNVTIAVGETLSSISKLCGFYGGPGSLGELVTIDCPPYTTGRYVKISLVTAVLTLCEVDVFVNPI